MAVNQDFSRLKLLVHVHIFYPQLYPELKACLENLRGLNFDLYVSFVEDHPEIEADIRAFKPDAVIIKCPNCGYDIAPFIDVLSRVDLNDYDLVVKLHTKRDIPVKEHLGNLCDVSGSLWREKLLSFIRDRDAFHRILGEFMNWPALGMAANHGLILSTYTDCDSNILRQVKDFMRQHSLPMHPKSAYTFVAGSMFIARSQLFIPLKELNLSFDDFPPMRGRKDERDLAHILERVFGWMVVSAKCVVNGSDKGYFRIKDPNHSITDESILHLIRLSYVLIFRRFRYVRKLHRFLFRIDERDGNRTIRILKIPVFRSASPQTSNSILYKDKGVPK